MGDPGAVFKAYDIRGIVPDELDPELGRAIGIAVARFLRPERLLVVRDMRPSGVPLCEAFADGARSEGTTVVDLGMASTDFLYFASGRLDAPGAMFGLAQPRRLQRDQTLPFGGPAHRKGHRSPRDPAADDGDPGGATVTSVDAASAARAPGPSLGLRAPCALLRGP